MRVVGCVLVLAGCGRVNFDSEVPRPEFSAPVTLAELSMGAGTDDPTLTQDQLEMFFASYRNASIYEQVWHSVRASTTSAWNPPVLATELNSLANTGSPELSADGLTLYTSKDESGSGDIYVSTRAALGDAFSTPALLPGAVNTSIEEFSGAPTEDGLELYYHVASASGGVGVGELWVATRTSTADPWSAGHRIDELADGYDARNPFPTAGGLALYFSSGSPLGDPTSTHKQVFRAVRATRAAAWQPAEPVLSLLDATENFQDPWLPEDQSRIYFSNGTELLVADAL